MANDVYNMLLERLDERPPLWEHLVQDRELLRCLLIERYARLVLQLPEVVQWTEQLTDAVMRKIMEWR